MALHVVIARGIGGSVDLAPDFQEEVLEKERALGRDHFTVLGIAPDASAEEIRAAYHAQSKRFHPDRFFRKELGPFRGKLERIFRRLNEANAILSDPAQRASYLAGHPELTREKLPEPVDPERQDERRSRLARHPYLVTASRSREVLAKARRLLDAGEHALALELLSGLLKAEPRNAEASALATEARKKLDVKSTEAALEAAERADREGRSSEALAAYQRVIALRPTSARAHHRIAELLLAGGAPAEQARVHAKAAAELAPDEPNHRVLFARVLVALGAKKLGRRELDAALALSPRHKEANALLKQVRWSLLGGDKP